MAETLKLRQAVEVSGLEVVGDRLVSRSTALTTGQHYAVQSKVIADNYGEDVLWAAGDGGLDTFTHGFIFSTHDVWVQLRNDDTGAAEYVRLFVPANVLAFLPPKIAGNTTDAFDGAVLVDNTDYADTDQIEVMRDAASGAGSAVVELHLFA